MKNNLTFLFPLDGDCVNVLDGNLQDTILFLPVSVHAPPGHEISICGVPVEFTEGVYRAVIPLSGYRNRLSAEDHTSGSICSIIVYYLQDAAGKFRLSSDDNILFLADITEHADTYTSIFENPYLAIYKKAHDLYGAKVHLNLFYEFIPSDDFSDRNRKYFNLSMMTDKFKDEFTANSDWLKLAFHARSELPDNPYQEADGITIAKDCIQVCREIIRFAGQASLNNSTTVHWGSANRQCVRALRTLGFRSLTGYFECTADGTPLVAYYTDGALLDHIGGRDFWVDTEEDMIFGRIDLVLNTGSFEYIMDQIVKISSDPHRGGFVSVMIHEQYFYPDYRGYLADFEQRVLDVCAFLHRHGYIGSHISDVITEPDLRVNPFFRY